MRDYKDYEHYGSRELICDPFFQEWVINPTAGHADFWKEFLLRYPAAEEKVQVARTFLQQLNFREVFPDESVVAASFEKHWEMITAENDQPERREGGKKIRLWKIAAAAAVVGVLLTIGITWYFSSGSRRQLQETQYGETRNIVLPDGSTGALNAH